MPKYRIEYGGSTWRVESDVELDESQLESLAEQVRGGKYGVPKDQAAVRDARSYAAPPAKKTYKTVIQSAASAATTGANVGSAVARANANPGKTSELANLAARQVPGGKVPARERINEANRKEAARKMGPDETFQTLDKIGKDIVEKTTNLVPSLDKIPGGRILQGIAPAIVGPGDKGYAGHVAGLVGGTAAAPFDIAADVVKFTSKGEWQAAANILLKTGAAALPLKGAAPAIANVAGKTKAGRSLAVGRAMKETVQSGIGRIDPNLAAQTVGALIRAGATEDEAIQAVGAAIRTNEPGIAETVGKKRLEPVPVQIAKPEPASQTWYSQPDEPLRADKVAKYGALPDVEAVDDFDLPWSEAVKTMSENDLMDAVDSIVDPIIDTTKWVDDASQLDNLFDLMRSSKFAETHVKKLATKSEDLREILKRYDAGRQKASASNTTSLRSIQSEAKKLASHRAQFWQQRAKQGGELGPNGEFYKGGQFIARFPETVKGEGRKVQKLGESANKSNRTPKGVTEMRAAGAGTYAKPVDRTRWYGGPVERNWDLKRYDGGEFDAEELRQMDDAISDWNRLAEMADNGADGITWHPTKKSEGVILVDVLKHPEYASASDIARYIADGEAVPDQLLSIAKKVLPGIDVDQYHKLREWSLKRDGLIKESVTNEPGIAETVGKTRGVKVADPIMEDLERIGEMAVAKERERLPINEILTSSSNGIGSKIADLYQRPYLTEVERKQILDAVRGGKSRGTLNFRGFIEDAGLSWEDLAKREQANEPGVAELAGKGRVVKDSLTGEATKSKEPWQMTREEFSQVKQAKGKAQVRKSTYRGEDGWTLTGKDGMGKAHRIFLTNEQEARRYAQLINEGHPDPIAEIWPKYARSQGTHYFEVKRALDGGKPVPAEVLADYPDLAAKYVKATPEAVPTPLPVDDVRPVQIDSNVKGSVGDAKAIDNLWYHGTTNADAIRRDGFKKRWTYLTDNKVVADSYQEWVKGGSPGTLEVPFTPKNPAYFDAGGQKYADNTVNLSRLIFHAASDAEKAGHDALIVKNIIDPQDSTMVVDPHTTVIVFDPGSLSPKPRPTSRYGANYGTPVQASGKRPGYAMERPAVKNPVEPPPVKPVEPKTAKKSSTQSLADDFDQEYKKKLSQPEPKSIYDALAYDPPIVVQGPNNGSGYWAVKVPNGYDLAFPRKQYPTKEKALEAYRKLLRTHESYDPAKDYALNQSQKPSAPIPETPKPVKAAARVEPKTAAKADSEDVSGFARVFGDEAESQGATIDDLARKGQELSDTGKVSPASVYQKVAKNEALTGEDISVGIYRQRQVRNRSKAIQSQLSDPNLDIGTRAALEAEMDGLIDEASLIHDTLKAARKTFHQAGQALQIGLKEDFSLSEIIAKARAANRGVPLGEVEGKLRGFVERMDVLEKELEDIRKMALDRAKKSKPIPLKDKEAVIRSIRGYLGLGKEAPVGSMGSKQSGAISIPVSEQTRVTRQVNALIKTYIEDGANTIDDVVARLKSDIGGIDDDDALSLISGSYKTKLLAIDVEKKKIADTLRKVKRDAAIREMPILNRVIYEGTDAVISLQRQLHAGLDASFAFIQGLPALLTHPKSWAGAWKQAAKTVKGGKSAAQMVSAELERRPMYANARKAGVAFSDMDGTLAYQEENLAGHILEKMRDGKIPVLKTYAEALSRSNEGYAAFLNDVRQMMFEGLVQGRSDDADLMRDMARLVNITTGRGDGKMAQALSGKHFAVMLYAPRYMLSTFQNAFLPLLLPSFKTAAGKKAAMKTWGKQVGVLMGVYEMAKLTLGEENVDTDIRSANFGQITLPSGQTINPIKKISAPVALPAQIALGRISQEGNFTKPSGYAAMGRIGQFVGGKASPVGRLGLNMATGERYDGESSKPFDLFTAEGAKVTAKDMFTPLAVQQALQDPSDMSHVVATMLGMDSAPKTKAKRVTAAPPMREGVIKNTIKSYNAGREKVKSRLKRGG